VAHHRHAQLELACLAVVRGICRTRHALCSDVLIECPQHSSHILEIAKRGAEHRYQELKAEIESLVKLFPHLPSRSGGLLSAPVETVKRALRRRRRRKMTAAARKAVSDRMKKFWAARRKATKV
jgi:hypothetical protein